MASKFHCKIMDLTTQKVKLGKRCQVKHSKITREKVVFNDCHGEGIPTFQHNFKNYNNNKKIKKNSTIHLGNKKVVTFPPYIIVPLKAINPTNHPSNKKVVTFPPYIIVPLKAINPTNHPSNVFHLATRLQYNDATFHQIACKLHYFPTTVTFQRTPYSKKLVLSRIN